MTLRRLIATAGFIGCAPRAPGTVASAVTCLAALPLLRRGAAMPVVATAVAACGLATLRRYPGIDRDPGEIVIDEVAGQLVALLPLAGGRARPWALATGFALFRVLDIVKPGPVGWADRKAGSFGVMGDDLIAGGLAAALLWPWVRRSDAGAAGRRPALDATGRRPAFDAAAVRR